MLMSMTGYGESRFHEQGLAITVEIRTINSRYFKLSLRCTDGYSCLEPRIESQVRKQIKRGTVQVGLRVDRELTADDYNINAAVLSSYRKQLEGLPPTVAGSDSINLDALLQLPGVVVESDQGATEAMQQWSAIEKPLVAALNNLNAMRMEEGRAMTEDLQSNCELVHTKLDLVDGRAGVVVENYRDRMIERVNKLLVELDVAVDETNVIREVGIFAERSDIAEEVVRLRSHLDQFSTEMGASESSGRKLDFLTQEMFREVNTIGSKANDSEISHHVIEIKAAVERMREMIQNVE